MIIFNLGETELVLSLPQHQANYNPTLAPSDIDILDSQTFENESPENERHITLIDNAWDYRFANSPINAGRLYLSICAFDLSSEEKNIYNFLDGSSFAKWIIARTEKTFSAIDKENIAHLKLNEIAVTDDDLCVYPKQTSDLEKIIRGGMHWYRGRTGHPSMGEPQSFFRLPIGQHYALEINIKFGGFNPEYFEFPETIEATKEFLLQEFLEQVRITYPPEILAQVTNTNNF
ncbi:MAG: hypothetical protein V4660_06600 [Pseudomonadota bacterium]